MSIIVIKPGSVSPEGLLQLKEAGHIVIETENKKDVQILDELSLPSTKDLLEAAVEAMDWGNDNTVRLEFGRLLRKKILARLKVKP